MNQLMTHSVKYVRKQRPLFPTLIGNAKYLNYIRKKIQGYDKHCFHSISWFFEQEPEGIILEDDCVPSLSFFGYCTTLLKKISETTNASDIYPEVIINSVKTGETELTIILT